MAQATVRCRGFVPTLFACVPGCGVRERIRVESRTPGSSRGGTRDSRPTAGNAAAQQVSRLFCQGQVDFPVPQGFAISLLQKCGGHSLGVTVTMVLGKLQVRLSLSCLYPLYPQQLFLTVRT